jgi:O-acetyl-ADP-ribose deacetylase (regulator of RNase III)
MASTKKVKKIRFMDCDRGFIAAIRKKREKIPDLVTKYGIKATVTNIETTTRFVRTAYVSAANSFVTMGGGVDAVYNTELFPGISKRIQQRIKYISNRTMNYPTDKDGTPYLPVGSALITPTDRHSDRDNCYIVSAPTMYRPMNVSDSTYAYWSFLAALQVIHESDWADNIDRIVCTGMCTGVGGMSVSDSAEQMLEAIKKYDEGERIVDCSPINNIVLHEFPDSNKISSNMVRTRNMDSPRARIIKSEDMETKLSATSPPMSPVSSLSSGSPSSPILVSPVATHPITLHGGDGGDTGEVALDA